MYEKFLLEAPQLVNTLGLQSLKPINLARIDTYTMLRCVDHNDDPDDGEDDVNDGDIDDDHDSDDNDDEEEEDHEDLVNIFFPLLFLTRIVMF